MLDQIPAPVGEHPVDLSKASFPAGSNPSEDLQAHFSSDLSDLAVDLVVDAMLVAYFAHGLRRMMRWIYS